MEKALDLLGSVTVVAPHKLATHSQFQALLGPEHKHTAFGSTWVEALALALAILEACDD
jgi:hypothetical protein